MSGRDVGPSLHSWVAEELRQGIQTEAVQGFLPSESELTSHFGVSRSVVRQSLSTLEGEGLIVKIRGKGSFVLPRERVHRVVQSLNGLGMQLEQLGGITRTEVLEYGVVDFPDAPEGWGSPEALRLVRLRYGYGFPLALIETRLHPRLADVISRTDLNDASLHVQLRQKAGIQLERSRRNILAVPATDVVSARLRTSVGAPTLLLQGTTYDSKGVAVEVFSTYHRGDRVAFDVETTLPPSND